MSYDDDDGGLIVAVASMSALKCDAVLKALESVRIPLTTELKLSHFTHFQCIPLDAVSGVDAQPVGHEQTMLGASNRAACAHRTIASQKMSARIVVSIENGIQRVTNPGGGGTGDDTLPLFVDIAWVLLDIISDDNTSSGGTTVSAVVDQRYWASSVGVPFPYEDVMSAKALGFETSTVGCAMHARDPQISSTHPHTSLLGNVLTRAKLLEQAIVCCIGQWICHMRTAK